MTYDITQYLVHHNANVNAHTRKVRCVTDAFMIQERCTALHSCDDVRIAKLLIENGARVTARTAVRDSGGDIIIRRGTAC